MNTTIQQRLALCPNLPTLPKVALKLVAIARDPDVDLGEITQLISNDPALTAKILRIANSSLYKQFRRVHSLTQAVHVLGLNATITLSLSFELAANLRAQGSAGIDLDMFWRRALIAAWAARTLGEHCHMRTLNELFLAGLLQDIGRLALDAAFPGEYAATQESETDHAALIACERDRLATDHLEAGAWLVQEWQLPEYVPLVIWGSHDCSRRGDDDLAALVACVAVSGRIADIYLAADTDAATVNAQHAAAACLGIDGETLGAILDQLAASLSEVESLFEMPVLPAAQARGLTARAQEIMICRSLQLLRTVTEEQTSEDGFRQIADHLYNVAHQDALTGVFNRRHFDDALDTAFAEAGGQRQPLSLAYLDLDHFKAINDRHGHLAGDVVLKMVAKTLQNHSRPSDLLARYGGEEFVMLLPGLDPTTAFRVVERIRRAVEGLAPALEDGTQIKVTLSAGLATYHDNLSTPTELLHTADQALYRAKHQGRNQVVQADMMDAPLCVGSQ